MKKDWHDDNGQYYRSNFPNTRHWVLRYRSRKVDGYQNLLDLGGLAIAEISTILGILGILTSKMEIVYEILLFVFVLFILLQFIRGLLKFLFLFQIFIPESKIKDPNKKRVKLSNCKGNDAQSRQIGDRELRNSRLFGGNPFITFSERSVTLRCTNYTRTYFIGRTYGRLFIQHVAVYPLLFLSYILGANARRPPCKLSDDLPSTIIIL